MVNFKKLSDFEVEALIEIPCDDGGLTDIEYDTDEECFIERDYLDIPDLNTNSNKEFFSSNIMGTLLIFFLNFINSYYLFTYIL
jgi:hypothetical protein